MLARVLIMPPACHGVEDARKPRYYRGMKLTIRAAAPADLPLIAVGGVTPGNLHSELVLRLKGQGFPQMPAGGLSPEGLEEVETWIREGAAVPQ